MPKYMNHNEFDFIDDLVHPFHSFLQRCMIPLAPAEGTDGQIDFHEQLYLPPKYLETPEPERGVWNWFIKKFL